MTAIRRTSDYDFPEEDLIEHLMDNCCVGCLVNPPVCPGIDEFTLRAAWPRLRDKVLDKWVDDRRRGHPWAVLEFEPWTVAELEGEE